MLGGLYLADEITFGDGLVTVFPALRFDFYDLDPIDDPLLPGHICDDGTGWFPPVTQNRNYG